MGFCGESMDELELWGNDWQETYRRQREVSKLITQELREAKHRAWVRKSDRSLLLLLVTSLDPLKFRTRSYRQAKRLYYAGRIDKDKDPDELLITSSMTASFSRLISRLENQGFIRRYRMGKRIHLCLTVKGREKLRWCNQEFSGEFMECFTYRFLKDKRDKIDYPAGKYHPLSFSEYFVIED
jgi:hypothetical protein